MRFGKNIRHLPYAKLWRASGFTLNFVYMYNTDLNCVRINTIQNICR